MVIGIIGENCSGKSTLAKEIRRTAGGEIVTGKDYLRLARSESEAETLFREKLQGAVSGENVIYVISEKEQLRLLPDGAVRILVKADLDTIRERFRARMRGNLPPPVEQMLVRNHGKYDDVPCDYVFDSTAGDPEAFCAELRFNMPG